MNELFSQLFFLHRVMGLFAQVRATFQSKFVALSTVPSPVGARTVACRPRAHAGYQQSLWITQERGVVEGPPGVVRSRGRAPRRLSGRRAEERLGSLSVVTSTVASGVAVRVSRHGRQVGGRQ